MFEASKTTIILVPTALESRAIFGIAPTDARPIEQKLLPGIVKVAICGFGLAGSGVSTARLAAEHRPRRFILVGLCGTYDESVLGLGTATLVGDVSSDGIGADYGAEHRRAVDMGFAESPCGPEIALPLTLPGNRQGLPCHPAISVAAISPSPHAAQAVRSRRSAAVVEDMETWSVALAARAFGVSLTVLRAASNSAGVRDKNQWRIKDALSALKEALRALKDEVAAP